MSFYIKPLNHTILDQYIESFIANREGLSTVWPLSSKQAKNILTNIHKQQGFIYIAIDNQADKIVWSIKLQLEQKFQNQWALSANIEELVTSPWYQWKGIGSSLMEYAIQEAEKHNVYKIVLDCSRQLIPFYNKFWFEQREYCMKKYI